MRSIVLLTAFGLTPGLAAGPPLCALPAPPELPIADHQIPVASADRPADPQLAIARAPAGSPQLPSGLAGVPFAQHVAAAGALVSDLGESHGLRSIAARSGDQFMIFQVTPDGEAGVSGAMTDLTPAQLAKIAAGNLIELGSQHGLRGFFVRSGAQFQVFYATPNQERVIPGVMWDAGGKDLTRQQVAKVPGAFPTVVVGGAEPGRQDAVPAASVAALPLVQKAAFGTIGPASAPHLWMLIDPQCIYSVRAFQMLQPYVASGRLQLSVIPLAVLDYEDQGQSTRSALALLSKPANQLVSAWQAGSVDGVSVPDAADRLRTNMAIAQAIRLQGTPTFVWRKADGTEGRIDGVPTSVDALVSSIGS